MSDDPIIDLPPEDIVPRSAPADHGAVLEELRSRLGKPLTVHVPGAAIEDVDGLLIGMTAPTTYTAIFGSLRTHTGDDHDRR